MKPLAIKCSKEFCQKVDQAILAGIAKHRHGCWLTVEDREIVLSISRNAIKSYLNASIDVLPFNECGHTGEDYVIFVSLYESENVLACVHYQGKNLFQTIQLSTYGALKRTKKIS